MSKPKIHSLHPDLQALIGSGGGLGTIVKITEDGSFTVPQNVEQMEVLIVAGGSGGVGGVLYSLISVTLG